MLDLDVVVLDVVVLLLEVLPNAALAVPTLLTDRITPDVLVADLVEVVLLGADLAVPGKTGAALPVFNLIAPISPNFAAFKAGDRGCGPGKELGIVIGGIGMGSVGLPPGKLRATSTKTGPVGKVGNSICGSRVMTGRVGILIKSLSKAGYKPSLLIKELSSLKTSFPDGLLSIIPQVAIFDPTNSSIPTSDKVRFALSRS